MTNHLPAVDQLVGGILNAKNRILCHMSIARQQINPAIIGSNMWCPINSEYQFFLYETITGQREKGKTFDQIAEWLNEKGYLSVRGKKFKGNHVHSIVKKKILKDEKFEKEYPEVRSDFSLEVVDKTLVNMFEGFLG